MPDIWYNIKSSFKYKSFKEKQTLTVLTHLWDVHHGKCKQYHTTSTFRWKTNFALLLTFSLWVQTSQPNKQSEYTVNAHP